MKAYLGIAVFLVVSSVPRVSASASTTGMLADLTVTHDYTSQRSSSEDRPGNDDWKRIEPGQTLTIAELDGPGEITHIWTTIDSRDPNHLRNLVIRCYWDGKDYPSVESPVGDFFGLGHGKYYVFDNLVQAIGTDRGMNCFWPMPFRSKARITVTNESDVPCDKYYYYVDYRRRESLPENTTYFHAQYKQAMPAVDGENYLVMETSGGQGHFAGVSMSIHTQVAGWWGEGDDIFTIDGETTPSIWGTGSEDYFSGAWGFGKEFYNTYFGMPLRTKEDQGADNYWNVYRLHMESPITFRKSIKVEMEHGHDGVSNTRHPRNNDYSSCAYWYVNSPRPLAGKLPPAADRLPEFRIPTVPEGVFEAQNMNRESSGGKVDSQGLNRGPGFEGDWLNGDQLFGENVKPGDTASLAFETTGTLNGDATLVVTRASDYGIIQVAIDGKEVATYDGFAPQVSRARVPLGPLKLEPGAHTIKITVKGKSDASKNTFWGIDYLQVGGSGVADDKDLPVVTPGPGSSR